ncbi:MAG: Bug family tripartite tricarboxylate transporter substrate binding protein [Burkholderiales bacterium]
MRQWPLFFTSAWIGLAVPLTAISQAYPNKPIRLVSQFVPGSSGDTSLRIISTAIGASLGQPVVMDNRAGAGGLLAAQQVLTAAPDGYTILASSSAFYVVRPFVVKDNPFDPAKSFTPITLYEEAFSFLVAHPGFAPNTMKEVLDYARDNPNRVTFGTSGIGTEGHLSGEQIMKLANVKLTHVPYKASALALADTVSGQISTSFSIHALALPFINSGKIKAIAVVSNARLPRVPTLARVSETIPDFDAPASWTGIFGPVGMTSALVRRIQSEFAKASKDPQTAAKLTEGGFHYVSASAPEEFSARLQREIALTASLVKTAGIKPE